METIEGDGVGEPEGFEEFVAASSTRLLRTAYLLTRDWGHAEDLLQTALAKSWSAWHRVRGDAEPYVRKIIVNTYATWWRRRWRAELPTAALPEQASAGADSGLAERDRVWRALGALPRRQRAVVVLRYFDDLSEAAVAELMGCSVGTVKSQASRAIATLRLDASLIGEETAR